MILCYLANVVIALQIVPFFGFEINSTDLLANVIQKLDEIKETNAANVAAFKKELLQQSDSIKEIKSTLSHMEHAISRSEYGMHLLLQSSSANLGELLLSEVENGDVERVRLLLDVGAPVEYEDNTKNRPIHVAVNNSHPRILEILLENKADIEAHGEYNWTALHMAGRSNCLECAQILIDKGVNLESRDEWGNTAILHPARMGFNDFIELLLDKGANVNAVRLDGTSGLHWAAREGRLSTVKLFVEKGANVWLQNFRGRTAKDYARVYRNQSVYDFLKKMM